MITKNIVDELNTTHINHINHCHEFKFFACIYLLSLYKFSLNIPDIHALPSYADDIIQSLYSSDQTVKLRYQVSIYYTILTKSLACLSCQS